MRPPHEAGEVFGAGFFCPLSIAAFNEAPARGGGGHQPGPADPEQEKSFNEAPARGGGGHHPATPC